MKISDIIGRVIDLARKVREYYSTELPKYHPNYPLIAIDALPLSPPPEEQELREFLSTLPDEMIFQLMLIMYLGRGDFETNDLASNYEALKSTFDDPARAVSQMMDKAPLADYLIDGLEQLRKHKINVDKMPVRKIAVQKR